MHKILLRVASGLILFVFLGHVFGHFTWKKSIPSDQAEALSLVASLEKVQIAMPGPLQHSMGEIMSGYSLAMSLFLMLLGILYWRRSGEKRVRSESLILLGFLCAMTVVSWLHFFLLPSVFLSIATVLVLVTELVKPVSE